MRGFAIIVLGGLFLLGLVTNLVVVSYIRRHLEQRHPAAERHVGNWTRYDRALLFWSWGDGPRKLADRHLMRLVIINRVCQVVTLGAVAGLIFGLSSV